VRVEQSYVLGERSLSTDAIASAMSAKLLSSVNTDTEFSLCTVQLPENKKAKASGGVSFKDARLLDKDSGGALFTRDAKFVEFEGDVYRVKNPFYSNYVAAEEVIMGSLFRMMGLGAPAMLLCNGCEDFFSFGKKTRADFSEFSDVSGFACVASQLEPSYKDLGAFLLDTSVMERLIVKAETHTSSFVQEEKLQSYKKLVETHEAADSRLNDIYTKYPGNSHRNLPGVLAEVRKENRIKFDVLEALNKYLPTELVVEQQKHFFASRLINNWDFLNFSFCNFGYFLPEGNEELQFKGMTVDFGGSGTLGFGGLSKNESFDRAIKGARPENPLESTSLFERSDSTFASELPRSLAGISTIPRSRPLLSTITDFVKQEAELYETKGLPLFEKSFSPALEVAYRLSVLPDEAVEKFLAEKWVMGAADFPYRDNDEKNNINSAKITAIMKGRKEAFVGYFGVEVIRRWEQQNILQAAQIRSEVETGLIGLIEGYKIKPLSIQSQSI